ncbi:MAG: TrmH family RNA methyltransferase [Pirellulales bacterium]
MSFEHLRHKPPAELERPRELIVACAPLRSNVNLSQILRLAGCCGLQKVIACGHAKAVDKIARDGAETVELEVHRTLSPVLPELRAQGYRLVGLEQTTDAVRLPDYRFERKTALIVGNERLGLEPDVLRLLDAVVEIPVFGRPYAYNVAMATAMALYEYCRQYPTG